jgi:hypothetical protein
MNDPEIAPSADAVGRQLERILASPGFRSARSVSRFLQYVVESQLQGRAGELKEYTIGLEVFGRGADFNPKEDGVVRVHARLLRKKLVSYYAVDGVDDPIVIDVQMG